MQNRESKAARYARRMIGLESPRAFFLSIPKCGCTYVKNLFWYLQEGEFHRNQVRVHDDEDRFPRAIDLCPIPEGIASEPRAFTVLRSPVDRLLSLYLDKVVGPGRKEFVPLADALLRKGGFHEAPTSILEHHHNLALLIDWIEANLESGTDLDPNPHWTPQSRRLDVIKEFDLKILIVESLSIGLQSIFRDVVSIRDTLALVERNRSCRSLPKSVYLSPQIRRRINSVYATDRDLYKRASEYWRKNIKPQALESSVPRLSDILQVSA